MGWECENRAVFVVLVTGSDYMETFDRLLQLNLQSVQEREIIRIILVCAARVRCAKIGSVLGKAVQPVLLSAFDAAVSQQAVAPLHTTAVVSGHLQIHPGLLGGEAEESRHPPFQYPIPFDEQFLTADLIRKFVLSLSILRIVDFGKHDKKTIYFLEVMITDFLENADDQNLLACVSRVGIGADFITVRDGLLLFLKSHMKPLVEDKPALKSRMRKMAKYLDRLGMNEDGDE